MSDEETRILVVEDTATTRKMMRKVLRESSYIVEVAENGLEALDRLDGEEFDLMLTDVKMPEMDGIELIRKLRERPATRSLPVIIISGETDEESRRAGYEAGANLYLDKPISAQKLIYKVRGLLGDTADLTSSDDDNNQ